MKCSIHFNIDLSTEFCDCFAVCCTLKVLTLPLTQALSTTCLNCTKKYTALTPPPQKKTARLHGCRLLSIQTVVCVTYGMNDKCCWLIAAMTLRPCPPKCLSYTKKYTALTPPHKKTAMQSPYMHACLRLLEALPLDPAGDLFPNISRFSLVVNFWLRPWWLVTDLLLSH